MPVIKPTMADLSTLRRMHVGIADHLGWAIAVTTDAEGSVVDRRRIELVEAGLSQAPIHYDRGHSDDAAMSALIAEVRASVARMARAAFDELPAGIESIALRRWPPDFPTDLATTRRAPYEARADAIMYRQVLADCAQARGWRVHLYDAKAVVPAGIELDPPWTKDHRIALAAALDSVVVAE